MSAFSAVVFDFDGVILESGTIKQQAFLDLYADRPELAPAILEHHRRHLGVSRFEKFAWIERELVGGRLTAERSAELGRRYSELVLEKTLACPLVPGAAELLGWLEGRLPAFVASATPQAELELIARRRGLDRFFDELHGSPGDKADVLAGVARRCGCPPDAVLMVGDGLSDFEAAERAGTRFVLRDTPEQVALFRNREVERVRDLVELRVRLAGWLAAVPAGAAPPEGVRS